MFTWLVAQLLIVFLVFVIFFCLVFLDVVIFLFLVGTLRLLRFGSPFV